MDKVNGSKSQAMPLWERQKNQRGHHSSVDGALKAHRQRTSDRQNRTQDRLNMVRNMTSQFFPTAHAVERPSVGADQLKVNPVLAAPVQEQSAQASAEMIAEINNFNPRQIDDIYNEAQLGSSSDNALVLVEKEITNPEEGPIDDMPKGSYVDYSV